MSSRGKKKQAGRPPQNVMTEQEKRAQARELWWQKHKKVVIIVICCVFVLTGVIVGVSVKSFGNPVDSSFGQYTLMDLGSQGCIPCDNLQPVLNSLRTKYSGKIDVKFYDVNRTSQGAQLANKYGVSTIPTLIFLDKNGTVVNRMVGYHSQSEIESAFRSLGWI